MTPEDIIDACASSAHAAHRAFCIATGAPVSPPWDFETGPQIEHWRDFAIDVLDGRIDEPALTVSAVREMGAALGERVTYPALGPTLGCAANLAE